MILKNWTMEEEIILDDDNTPSSGAPSTMSNDEACVPQLQEQQVSQSTVGSSTPHLGHEYEPFIVPSDISCVSSVSNKSTAAKRAKKSKPHSQPKCSTPKGSDSLPENNLLNLVQNLSLAASTDSNGPAGSSSRRSATLRTVSSILSSSDDDEDIPRRKKFKRTNKGRDWALYKPKHDNRIYTFIVENPENSMDVANKWIKDYRNNSKDAIIALLQFMVDVSCFPQFNLTSKFKFEEENYKEVVRFMEQHPPQIQQKGNYLMRGTSEWCKQTHYGIFEFLKNILQIAHESEILYDNELIRYIIGFPIFLITSVNRSMFHTGVSFVLKMYTTLLNIHKQILSRTMQTSSRDPEHLFPTLIKELQSIIERTCLINDSSTTGVRVLFCEEVWKWFKKDPPCITNTKFFRRLLSCVCDQSQRVRRAALNTCYKLVENIKFSDYISNYMKDFITTVGGRIQDVDFTVAITAIKIFTSMIRTYPNELSNQYRNQICKLVYYDHYNLALAAGKFIIEMLNPCIDSDDTPCKLIQELVKILQATQTTNCAAVFVEALIHNCPELQEFNEIINLLLSDNLEDDEEVVLVDIFCQAVHQTLTGRSRIPRKKAPHGHRKTTNTKNDTNVILLNLHRLLIKFSNEPNCAQLLIELLLIIDFDHLSVARHINPMVNTINILNKKFIGTNNLKLLETVSKVFVRFLEEHCVVKHRVEGSIMNVMEAVCEIFLKCLTDCLSEIHALHQDDLAKLESSFLKMSVLSVDHDLTEMISYDNLADNWSNFEDMLPPKCMRDLIKIVCWNLIWQFRVIIENGSKAEPANELQQEIIKLKAQCSDYIQKCLQLIKNAQHVQLSEMAFQCISDILLKFYDIENSIRSNQALKGLLPTFNESSQEVFMTFTRKVLFDSTFKSPLKIRRVILGNVINIVFLGAINILQLPKLYVNYNSHHEDYGDILTSGLQKLHDNNPHNIVGVILISLTYNYEKMIANVATFKIGSERSIALSKLAAQFQLYVKKFPAQLKSLLKMGINYSVSSESNYTFLDFIKCFASTLSMEDKTLILNYFNENLPDENKNHEALLGFATYLKKKSYEKTTAKEKSKSTSSVTTSITSIEVSVSDDINDFDTDYAISDFSDNEV